MAQSNEAPGKAMAQPESTSQVASSDVDPLAPKAVVAKKTRYTDRIPTEAATKQAAKAAKAKEKAAAAPPPITVDEKATTQTQAAPLGLNGDTAKKTKPAKVKGAPKERLQNKDMTPPPPPPPPAPTVNPALGATPPGATPVAPTPAPATPPPATPPAAPQPN
jgi:peptidyl-prolyl cis-trans isomerase SurA